MLARAWWRLDCWYRARRYRTRVDPEEIAWLRSVLRPGDVVVDAGAYKGGYTYWMRLGVGSEGHVYAFEPQPELARHIRRAVAAFDWRNVTIAEAGLSSDRGERLLHAPGAKPNQDASLVGALAPAGARRYPVHIETLDAFLAQREERRPVALVKCDVEGHELDVFRGATRVLEGDRPRVLFECEARHDPSRSVEAVFSFLGDLGYRGRFFWKGALLDVSEFRVDVHQRLGHLPYANNFVFEPAGARPRTAPGRA